MASSMNTSGRQPLLSRRQRPQLAGQPHRPVADQAIERRALRRAQRGFGPGNQIRSPGRELGVHLDIRPAPVAVGRRRDVPSHRDRRGRIGRRWCCASATLSPASTRRRTASARVRTGICRPRHRSMRAAKSGDIANSTRMVGSCIPKAYQNTGSPVNTCVTGRDTRRHRRCW